MLGVDVARRGTDMSLLGIRQGRHFRIYAELRNVSTAETANKVIECIEAEKPDGSSWTETDSVPWTSSNTAVTVAVYRTGLHESHDCTVAYSSGTQESLTDLTQGKGNVINCPLASASSIPAKNASLKSAMPVARGCSQ